MGSRRADHDLASTSVSGGRLRINSWLLRRDLDVSSLIHLAVLLPWRQHGSNTSQKRRRNAHEIRLDRQTLGVAVTRSGLHVRKLRAGLGPAPGRKRLPAERNPAATPGPLLIRS